MVRRDTGEKFAVKRSQVMHKIAELLEDIQNHLFDKAHEHIKKNVFETESWSEFLKGIDKKKIIYAPFCGEEKCEDEIKDKTKGANSRCIPFNQKKIDKKCVHCGKKAEFYAYFGKCY